MSKQAQSTTKKLWIAVCLVTHDFSSILFSYLPIHQKKTICNAKTVSKKSNGDKSAHVYWPEHESWIMNHKTMKSLLSFAKSCHCWICDLYTDGGYIHTRWSYILFMVLLYFLLWFNKRTNRSKQKWKTNNHKPTIFSHFHRCT